MQYTVPQGMTQRLPVGKTRFRRHTSQPVLAAPPSTHRLRTPSLHFQLKLPMHHAISRARNHLTSTLAVILGQRDVAVDDACVSAAGLRDAPARAPTEEPTVTAQAAACKVVSLLSSAPCYDLNNSTSKAEPLMHCARPATSINLPHIPHVLTRSGGRTPTFAVSRGCSSPAPTVYPPQVWPAVRRVAVAPRHKMPRPLRLAGAALALLRVAARKQVQQPMSSVGHGLQQGWYFPQPPAGCWCSVPTWSEATAPQQRIKDTIARVRRPRSAYE